MSWSKTFALSALLLVASGARAHADVVLTISNGRVSLSATSATIGEILGEWATVGQTRILNLESAPRERVTIELRNVSELRALDVVLRPVGGYLAIERAADADGASRLSRIVILRQNTLPPPSAAVAINAAAALVEPVRVSNDPAPFAPTVPDEGRPTDQGEESAPQTVVVSGDVSASADRTLPGNARRQAVEVVDPREFKLPAPQPGATPSASGGQLPQGAPMPGMLVKPVVRPPGAPRQ